MPLPEGFETQTVFASDETFNEPGQDWDGEPNKLPLTGLAQGIAPGETVPAEVLNREWNLASKLAVAHAPIEALNWSRGEDPVRAGLDDFLVAQIDYIASERLWIGVGLTAGAKHMVVSYNGTHWTDVTPGGFPGALNLCVSGDIAVIFVANGEYYTRAPDQISGVMEGPTAATTIAAWANASGNAADNTQSVMADPDVPSRVWVGGRTAANVPKITKILGDTGFAVVLDAETSGLAAFTWSVNEYVSFTHQAGRRVVCFVATDAGLVVRNIIRWSDDAPSYGQDWVGSAINTLNLTSAVGKVVGFARMPDDRIVALTTLGRAYQSSDLQTWTRIDNPALDDEVRSFKSCVQVGAITYARGTWGRPSTGGFLIEGIFHSLDYGETWCFEASPLRAFDPDALDLGRRLRGHGDRLSYIASNLAAEMSEIALSFLTGPTRRS